LALVALSVVEERYRAVMAVLDGARISEVAAEIGVSRQSVSSWLVRYRRADGGRLLAGRAAAGGPRVVGDRAVRRAAPRRAPRAVLDRRRPRGRRDRRRARLGHASVAITLDRYGHLFPGNEQQAAGSLDA
jgi:transposase-like protein